MVKLIICVFILVNDELLSFNLVFDVARHKKILNVRVVASRRKDGGLACAVIAA